MVRKTRKKKSASFPKRAVHVRSEVNKNKGESRHQQTVYGKDFQIILSRKWKEKKKGPQDNPQRVRTAPVSVGEMKHYLSMTDER